MASQLRVLIAENDSLIRAMIVDVLTDNDFDVPEASSGPQAIHLMDDPDHIQLVVTDLNMPGVDGIAVARHARAHHPGVPILFISGRPDLLVAGNPPKPFCYLAKPFRLASLMSAIGGLVGNR